MHKEIEVEPLKTLHLVNTKARRFVWFETQLPVKFNVDHSLIYIFLQSLFSKKNSRVFLHKFLSWSLVCLLSLFLVWLFDNTEFELVLVGDLQLQHVVHRQQSYMTFCLYKSICYRGSILCYK